MTERERREGEAHMSRKLNGYIMVGRQALYDVSARLAWLHEQLQGDVDVEKISKEVARLRVEVYGMELGGLDAIERVSQ